MSISKKIYDKDILILKALDRIIGVQCQVKRNLIIKTKIKFPEQIFISLFTTFLVSRMNLYLPTYFCEETFPFQFRLYRCMLHTYRNVALYRVHTYMHTYKQVRSVSTNLRMYVQAG
jgi:hypothetical protein